jgi:hypothetical protein
MLRPNKQVERKVMIDILRDVFTHANLDSKDYMYIGMGSIYYYDFIMLHKSLRLGRMKSIDDKDTPGRFNFNKPYDFVEFENMKSTDFLSDYGFDRRIILWLDYDFQLCKCVFDDLTILAKKCNEGDVLFITLDASDSEADKDTRSDFIRANERYISSRYQKNYYVSPKYFPMLLQDILKNCLLEAGEYNDAKFRKIFAFTYRDSAPMFTLGGLFTDNDKSLESLEGNEFVSLDDRILDIGIPQLTYKEKIHLDANITLLRNSLERIRRNANNNPKKMNEMCKRTTNRMLDFEIESFSELQSYATFHRYYPQYYEGMI